MRHVRRRAAVVTELATADIARLFRALSGRLAAERDELCRLDGIIGDADHGIAMTQGFAAASEAVASLGSDATLADQFNAAAKALLNAVGASSGPLYATALLRAGKAAGPRQAMPLQDAPLLVAAMADGIAFRGKAVPGEKTMIDAWAPAADAVREARAGDLAISESLSRMREAALSGAASTAAMIATKGRSARLGERSRGHKDPGAASAAVIIQVIADDWASLANG